jgi:hypothetical protein
VSALFGFGIGQRPAQSASQSRHDLILQLEQVGHVLLEAVGPQMRAGFGVDKLRIDAHAVLVPLNRTFEDITNAKLRSDLFGVEVLAFESEGRIASDNEAVLDAR